jgi:hypothetical protein
VSLRRLAALRRGVGAEIAHWAMLVRGARGEGARERLRAAARSDAGLGELVSAIEHAPSRDAGVAELNDRALELDRVLDVGAEIPRSAARIALFTGTACAIVVVMSSLADKTALTLAVASFGCGLGGAVGCAMIGRAASARARSQRGAWTELGRALERALPDPQ